MPRDPRATALLLSGAGAAVSLTGWVIALVDPTGPTLPDWLLFAAGFAYMIAAPGWLLVEVALPDRSCGDALERALLALGSGYALAVVWGMAVHALPGPMLPGMGAGAFGLLSLILGLAALWRRPHGRPARVPGRGWLQVGAVALLAGLLRIVAIGHSEVQGDEATILLKAAAALAGRFDAVLVHKKGPAEILLATLFHSVDGRASEELLRMPFAVAAMVGIVAVQHLGRRMFGGTAGFIAGLLLAVNGFYIAFARIVQYQAIVFLMSAMAILCAWRLMRGSSGLGGPAGPPWPAGQGASDRRQDGALVGLGALFVAVGLLAHYDAVFALPPMAYLVWRRWRRADPDERRSILRSDARRLALAGAVAAVLLAAFFVPLATHPYFRSTTWSYLVETRLSGGSGDGLFHNKLLNSATLAVFYNSSYFMLVIAGLLVAEVARRLARGAGAGRLGQFAVAGGLVIAFGALLARPEWTRVGGIDITPVVLFALAVVALWRAEAGSGWRAAWLWFIVPFAVYAGIVKSPRTHFHVAFPGWSLLAALPVAWAWARLAAEPRLRVARPLAGAVAAALLAVFAAYSWHVFVRTDVEYRRTYPAGAPLGYWNPLPDLPSAGWFGFPYRAGWKAIGALYAEGSLRGDYHSNEEEWVTHWYTRGMPRCDQRPRYIFLAEAVQDVRPVPEDPAAAGYVMVAEITSGGRPRIAVWQRADLAATDLRFPAPAAGERVPRIALEAAEPLFDAVLSRAPIEDPLPYAQDLRAPLVRPGVVFGSAARLVAADVDPPHLDIAPGARVLVTLVWESLAPVDKDYSVFLHAEREGRTLLAQDDGAPAALTPKGACGGERPTTTWMPGDRIIERRTLEIPADAATGDFPLLVGLYDYETLDRLPAVGPDGADAGTSAEIGRLRVSRRPASPPPHPAWPPGVELETSMGRLPGRRLSHLPGPPLQPVQGESREPRTASR